MPGPLYLAEYKAACAVVAALEGPLPEFLAAREEFHRICWAESSRRKCRLCGCTEESPCVANVDGEEIVCGWRESDLCNFCHSSMFRDDEIKTSREGAMAVPLEAFG